MTLLEKQKNKLAALEKRVDELWDQRPWQGHGGTPLVNNSKGRAMSAHLDRYESSLRSAMRAVEEQKKKIERTLDRGSSVPTKASDEFIAKNPISPLLLWLRDAGKVSQWAKNPQIFFVKGLHKVALMTLSGKVGINKRYCAKTVEERDICLNLIKEAESNFREILGSSPSCQGILDSSKNQKR